MHDKYRPIVKDHLPRGYKLKETPLRGKWAGYATSDNRIICEPIINRELLFLFLHECGHVHNKHVPYSLGLPAWQEEYEADQYAIEAMRALSIPIPRDRLKYQRSVVRMALELDSDGTDDIKVLKYAYGKDWKRHR